MIKVIGIVLITVSLTACSMTDKLRKEDKETHGRALVGYSLAESFFESLLIGDTLETVKAKSEGKATLTKGEYVAFQYAVPMILPHTSLTLEDTSEALAKAIRGRSLVALRLKGGKSKTVGQGNLVKELTTIEKITRTKGWKAEILLFFSNGVLIDKTMSGTQSIDELKNEADYGKALNPKNLLKII